MSQILLIPFDSWYDAGRNYCKVILRIWNESEKFTLKDYPSRQEWEDMVENWLDNCIKVLSLESVEEEYILRFQLLCEIGLTFKNSIKLFADLFLLSPMRRKNKYNEELQFDRDDLVPFMTKTGAYGLNTYLFMYSQGLKLLAITPTPIAAHVNLRIDTSETILDHDLDHTKSTDRLGIGSYRLFYEDASARIHQPFGDISSTLNDIRRSPRRLIEIYNQLMVDSSTSDNQKKAQVYALFIGLHENIDGLSHLFTLNDIEYAIQIINDTIKVIEDTSLEDAALRIEGYSSYAEVITEGINLYSKYDFTPSNESYLDIPTVNIDDNEKIIISNIDTFFLIRTIEMRTRFGFKLYKGKDFMALIKEYRIKAIKKLVSIYNSILTDPVTTSLEKQISLLAIYCGIVEYGRVLELKDLKSIPSKLSDNIEYVAKNLPIYRYYSYEVGTSAVRDGIIRCSVYM